MESFFGTKDSCLLARQPLGFGNKKGNKKLKRREKNVENVC